MSPAPSFGSPRNTSQQPVDVSLLASLQNAVGSQGAAGIQGVRFAGYGGNRNRVVRQPGMVAVAMDKSPDPIQSGNVKVRSEIGSELVEPDMLWLTRLGGFTGQAAESLADIVADGGVALVDGLQPGFFDAVARLRDQSQDAASLATLFEDFESKSYEGWTLTGDAFGKQPSRGTEASQQPVSGFAGRGLVNTFIAGDGPQGRATSNLLHRAALHRLPDRRRQPCRRDVRQPEGRRPSRPHRGGQERRVARTGQLGCRRLERQGCRHRNRRPAFRRLGAYQSRPDPVFRHPAGGAVETRHGHGNGGQGRHAGVRGRRGRGTCGRTEGPADRRVSGAQRAVAEGWQVTRFTRLRGVPADAPGYRVWATTPAGDPLILEGPLGKGRIILVLAPDLPWSWGSALLPASRGEPLKPGERLVPGTPGWGTMALVALDEQAVALPGWSTPEAWAAFAAGLAPQRSGPRRR